MGLTEVIALSEGRASSQWQQLRDDLHARFDQWLDQWQEQRPDPPTRLAAVTEAVWQLRQELTGGLSETIVEHAHRGERHVQAHVVHVVLLPPDIGQNPHHLKAHSVDQDEAADRRPAGKQVLHHLVAEYANRTPLRFIAFIQPAAFSHGQVADGGKVGRAAGDRAAAAGKFADCA